MRWDLCLAEVYSDGTLRAWDRLMAQETADEERDEMRVRETAHRPHVYYEDEMIPGFCERCGYAHRLHVRGISPAELSKRGAK